MRGSRLLRCRARLSVEDAAACTPRPRASQATCMAPPTVQAPVVVVLVKGWWVAFSCMNSQVTRTHRSFPSPNFARSLDLRSQSSQHPTFFLDRTPAPESTRPRHQYQRFRHGGNPTPVPEEENGAGKPPKFAWGGKKRETRKSRRRPRTYHLDMENPKAIIQSFFHASTRLVGCFVSFFFTRCKLGHTRKGGEQGTYRATSHVSRFACLHVDACCAPISTLLPSPKIH